MNFKWLIPFRPYLLAAAVAGFLSFNVPFLYYALIATDVYFAALRNGMALAFMGEAFFLVALLALLIHKSGCKKPGWVFFVVMSLLGSLAFSVPLQLYLLSKPVEKNSNDNAHP